ncbi:hypothetical protein PG991_012380 [Apiospora marii]|uniref:Ankyrin n=1 Tax=Apiospora marii TaxID=335849 RepID=A0ABR1RBH5_9PEZI
MVLTSRPYESIISSFGSLHEDIATLRIPGETQLAAISEEINIVIKHRVQDLSQRLGLNDSLKAYLERRLLMIPHRTYLWIHLVFDYLEDRSFKKTDKGIDEALRTLPSTVEDAYEAILQRAHDKHFAFKAFCLVLAATRPLNLGEMNEAINTLRDTKSAEQLDLESLYDFKSTVRRECGLMISVYRNKVYFLHQTVREFLYSVNKPSKLLHLDEDGHAVPEIWYNSISPQIADKVFGDCCLTYLNLIECRELEAQVERELPSGDWRWISPDYKIGRLILLSRLRRQFIHDFRKAHKFHAYCCSFWRWHVLESNCPDLQVDDRCRSLFTHGPMLRDWVDCNGQGCDMEEIDLSFAKVKDQGYDVRLCNTSYMIHLRLTKLVEDIVQEDTKVLNFDERTPRVSLLNDAIRSGGYQLAQRLLQLGADPNDHHRRKLALGAGKPEYILAEVAEKAMIYGGVDMIPQFIAMGADVTATGCHGSILHLCWGWDWVDSYPHTRHWPWVRQTTGAAIRQRVACKALIEHGADINFRNHKGRTALFHANSDVIKLLLESGADIQTQDDEGFAPLHFPLDGEAVETYVSSGIPVNAIGGCGMSPLMCVCKSQWPYFNENVARLVELGADPTFVSPHGQTVLHFIAVQYNGQGSLLKLLVAKGLDVNAQDVFGMTPLHYASYNPHKKDLVKPLLDEGADPTIRDRQGRTAFHLFIMNPLAAIDALKGSLFETSLLYGKHSIMSKDSHGRHALHYASSTMRLVECLVEEGFSPIERDDDGKNLLDLLSERLVRAESSPAEAIFDDIWHLHGLIRPALGKVDWRPYTAWSLKRFAEELVPFIESYEEGAEEALHPMKAQKAGARESKMSESHLPSPLPLKRDQMEVLKEDLHKEEKEIQKEPAGHNN